MSLWSVYHEKMPEFLIDFCRTKPMQRLQGIGMNCGLEYTGFPRFAAGRTYTRYEHSVGVALIVWHFTGDMAQSIAGLLHDIATPVFAHTIDFLNGDYEVQESTEANTATLIRTSEDIQNLLMRYGLSNEAVEDYHQYPIADNDAPRLSADRLEYTLSNAVYYGFCSRKEVAEMYANLSCAEEELVFKTPELACRFARAALQNARVYASDEDRFCMQALADILHTALEKGVLFWSDLYTTERMVIEKLQEDDCAHEAWKTFMGYNAILRAAARPEEGVWYQIPAKKRLIDPMIEGAGRVTAFSTELKEEMDAFLAEDFGVWLQGFYVK